MCGRYTLFGSADEISALFGVALSGDQLAAWRSGRGYNIAPSQQAPLIRQGESGRQAGPARWGFHPAWAGDDAPSPINARAESVLAKGYFRGAMRHGRCLVPTNGWYEWQAAGNAPRQPYFIRPAGRDLFALAGICTPGAAPSALTFAIIVGEAASDLAGVHARQPVVVRPDDFDAWLAPATSSDRLDSIMKQRAERHECRPVDRRVGNPRNDEPALLGL